MLFRSLHLDESTPHIHERHVFDCENQYGEIAPQQEKALEALGFELPEPEKPVGRKNNRKMTFDSACRVLLFDVAKKHGLQLEEEPEYGGRAYLEKQDYILFKQKEQLAVQEQKLEELTMKIEDVEALVDSGILFNATRLRDALRNHTVEIFPKLQLKGFSDFTKVNGDELIEEISSAYSRDGMEETMIISRSNKRATIYNNGIRNRRSEEHTSELQSR